MDEQVSDKIKEVIGEVQSRCTSFSVGRMLIKEAALEFCDDNTEIIYEDE